MRAFSELFRQLDETTSTNTRIDAMAAYFADVSAADGAWAVWFLAGRRLKRLVGPARLRRALEAAAPYPPWLVAESHAQVGDLAETAALLLEAEAQPRSAAAQPGSAAAQPGPAAVPGLAALVQEELLPLGALPEPEQQQRIVAWWHRLDTLDRLVFTKLLTGALRVGVSQLLVARALEQAFDVPRTRCSTG